MHAKAMDWMASRASCQHYSFREHLLSSRFNYSFGIASADLFGSGGQDIIATDAWTQGDTGSGGSVRVFRNKNNGAFDQHYIASDVKGTKIVRGKSHSLLERLDVGDVTGDGWLDIVVVDLFDDRLLIFHNSGELQAWPVEAVGPVPQPVDVKLADLTGTGTLDIVVASLLGGVYAFYNDLEWRCELICRPPGWTHTRSVTVACSGPNAELIATDLKAGEVARIFREGNAWTYEIIASGLRQPWHGSLYGNSGFVFGSKDGIHVLLRENGDWHLSTVADISRPRNSRWFEVVAADIDADGRMELVASVMPEGDDAGGSLVVFYQDSGTYRPQVLKQGWGKVNQVIVQDLTGNGLLDIVASTERPVNEVRYWLQTPERGLRR